MLSFRGQRVLPTMDVYKSGSYATCQIDGTWNLSSDSHCWTIYDSAVLNVSIYDNSLEQIFVCKGLGVLVFQVKVEVPFLRSR